MSEKFKISNLDLYYGDFHALKDINMSIHANEITAFIGPSGCGKTTILRMIAGFESPDEGEIYLGNEAINELTPNKRDTAMVFQSYAPGLGLLDLAVGVAGAVILYFVVQSKIKKARKFRRDMEYGSARWSA